MKPLTDKIIVSSGKSVEEKEEQEDNEIITCLLGDDEVQEVNVTPLEKIIDCEVEENELYLNKVKSGIKRAVHFNDVNTDEVNKKIKNENISESNGTDVNRTEIEGSVDELNVEEAAIKEED